MKVGYKSINKSGEVFEIIKKLDYPYFLVRFERSGFIKRSRADAIKNNSVRDPYTATKYGVGFIGDGPYVTELDGAATPSYIRWNNMLSRCYNENNRAYVSYGAIGTTVSEEWHCFQNFADWFVSKGKPEWSVDKDLCSIGGSKIYSKETCVVVPTYVNNSIIHQKNVTNGYPIGVWYDKYGAKAKYTSELGKKCLGYFNTPSEAHKAWQIAKAKSLQTTLERYVKEDFTEEMAIGGLTARIKMLYSDAEAGKITETL